MTAREAKEILESFGICPFIDNTTDNQLIYEAERMLRRIDHWEKGYAKHKAEMKGYDDE